MNLVAFQIGELAMIPFKDVKELLYKLFDERMVKVQVIMCLVDFKRQREFIRGQTVTQKCMGCGDPMIPCQDQNYKKSLLMQKMTHRFFELFTTIYFILYFSFTCPQEVSKTSDYAPSRTFYLFAVDLPSVVRLLMNRCYQVRSYSCSYL